MRNLPPIILLIFTYCIYLQISDIIWEDIPIRGSIMKKLISFLLILTFVLTAFPTTKADAAIKINKKTITIEIGETYNLQITGAKSAVKWSSSDADIATVSKSGKVTGVSIGQATIRAKVKTKTYSCDVHVWPEDKNIILYEDDNLRLAYFNTVDGWVYFTIANKTNEIFSLTDTYLILDKITYPRSGYCSEVPPNYTDIYVYNTESDTEEIDKLSGSFYIFDKDGITIDEFEFKDVKID